MYRRDFHLTRYAWNLILGTFKKICPENPDLVNIVQKYQAIYMKTWVRLILLAAPYLVQRELQRIVVLLWQRFRYLLQCWRQMYLNNKNVMHCCDSMETVVSEWATVLRDTYCRFPLHVVSQSSCQFTQRHGLIDLDMPSRCGYKTLYAICTQVWIRRDTAQSPTEQLAL